MKPQGRRLTAPRRFGAHFTNLPAAQAAAAELEPEFATAIEPTRDSFPLRGQYPWYLRAARPVSVDDPSEHDRTFDDVVEVHGGAPDVTLNPNPLGGP